MSIILASTPFIESLHRKKWPGWIRIDSCLNRQHKIGHSICHLWLSTIRFLGFRRNTQWSQNRYVMKVPRCAAGALTVTATQGENKVSVKRWTVPRKGGSATPHLMVIRYPARGRSVDFAEWRGSRSTIYSSPPFVGSSVQQLDSVLLRKTYPSLPSISYYSLDSAWKCQNDCKKHAKPRRTENIQQLHHLRSFFLWTVRDWLHNVQSHFTVRRSQHSQECKDPSRTGFVTCDVDL